MPALSARLISGLGIMIMVPFGLAACGSPPEPDTAPDPGGQPEIATAAAPPAGQTAIAPQAARTVLATASTSERGAPGAVRPLDPEATLDPALFPLPPIEPGATAPPGDVRIDDLGRIPAPVESVDVTVSGADPPRVEAVVTGYLPDPCTQIQDISQRYDADALTFFVHIGMARPPGVACVQVITPYTETVPLDITGLGPGTYIVDVNGVASPFTLE